MDGMEWNGMKGSDTKSDQMGKGEGLQSRRLVDDREGQRGTRKE